MQNFRQQLLKTTKQLFDIPESHFPAFYEHDWDRPSHAKKKNNNNKQTTTVPDRASVHSLRT